MVVAGSRRVTVPVERRPAWSVWNTVPGSVSSVVGLGNWGSHPGAQARSPVGVNRVMASLGGSGTRMLPVRRTRLHAGMWLLLVGAVQLAAVAGGQVESVDLLELLDGLD